MIVWCDLETTGLNPRTGSILEIAMIATDDNFVQIGEPFVSVVRPLHARGLEVMDDYVKKMHAKSGLIHEIWNFDNFYEHPDCVGFDAYMSLAKDVYDPPTLRDEVPRLGDVERAAIEWCLHLEIGDMIPPRGEHWDVRRAGQPLKQVPLAGNTVHFDKRWLIEHMDDLERLFSHRIYDVSSFTEEAKRSAPEIYAKRPGLGPDGKPVPMHRALDDIMNSIATAKFYRECCTWGI